MGLKVWGFSGEGFKSFKFEDSGFHQVYVGSRERVHSGVLLFL